MSVKLNKQTLQRTRIGSRPVNLNGFRHNVRSDKKANTPPLSNARLPRSMDIAVAWYVEIEVVKSLSSQVSLSAKMEVLVGLIIGLFQYFYGSCHDN